MVSVDSNLDESIIVFARQGIVCFGGQIFVLFPHSEKMEPSDGGGLS